VEAQQPSDNPKPTPAPAEIRARSIRVIVSAFIGIYAGGLIGWLIDSAITSSPYAGVRFGALVGGLLGGMVIGAGTGWRGAVLVLCIVCCMTAGGFAGIDLWNPDPNSFVMFIPAGIGVIVGAIVGLGLAAVLLRVLFRPRPPDNSRQA
jgi:hypothetical protein